MKAIDPVVEPRSTGTMSSRSNDLVFLDLDERRTRSNSIIAKRATQGLDIIHTGEYQEIPAPAPEPELLDTPAPTSDVLDTPALEPAVLDGVTRAAEYVVEDPSLQPGPLDGLDTTGFDSSDESLLDPSSMMLDLEPTDMGAAFADATLRGTPISVPAQSSSSSQPVVEDELLDFAPEPQTEERPSLDDVPIIDEVTTADSSAPMRANVVDDVDETPIGGDLTLIMPDSDESSA
jgi:hypothetical protein